VRFLDATLHNYDNIIFPNSSLPVSGMDSTETVDTFENFSKLLETPGKNFTQRRNTYSLPDALVPWYSGTAATTMTLSWIAKALNMGTAVRWRICYAERNE
jgi:hypothetical protein